MALVKDLYFGTPSGRIGDLVYRTIEGKTYVCRRPSKRTSPYTPKEIANKKRFSLFTKVCQAMNGDFIINSLWKRSGLPGRCNNNKQMLMNYAAFGTNADMTAIKIFPSVPDFNAAVLSALVEDESLKITFQLSENANFISEVVYPEISFHGVIELSDNAAENAKPTLFLTLTSSGAAFIKGVPIEIQQLLQGEIYPLVSSYPLRKFAGGLALKDINGNVSFVTGNLSGIF